jgi:hypothetical protein
VAESVDTQWYQQVLPRKQFSEKTDVPRNIQSVEQ